MHYSETKYSVNTEVIFNLLYLSLLGLLEAMTTPPYTDYVILQIFLSRYIVIKIPVIPIMLVGLERVEACLLFNNS
jgi:hypothetical protein